MTHSPPSLNAKSWSRYAIAMLVVSIGLAACDKFESLNRNETGKAFINSQIPPDLAPKYYPPSGFVFSGFKTRGLPEARYGVASPPINPRAQVLILVEADYPAEAYFGIMRDLLDGGYSVWLLELPGQGGAGRFDHQHEAIDMPDYHDGMNVIHDFINNVISPTESKPLYLIGTGVSATQSLVVYKTSQPSKIKGVFAYDPYTGTPMTRGDIWHRQDKIETQIGQIAQSWQIFNPDLRLKAHSDKWIEAQQKIVKALNAPNLPNISLKQTTHKVWVLAPEVATPTQSRSLKQICHTVENCSILGIDTMSDIGSEIVSTLTHEQSEPHK